MAFIRPCELIGGFCIIHDGRYTVIVIRLHQLAFLCLFLCLHNFGKACVESVQLTLEILNLRFVLIIFLTQCRLLLQRSLG